MTAAIKHRRWSYILPYPTVDTGCLVKAFGNVESETASSHPAYEVWASGMRQTIIIPETSMRKVSWDAYLPSGNRPWIRFSIVLESEEQLIAVKQPLKHNYYNANPRIHFRYTPASWGGISFIGNVNTVSPSVNQLNPVIQQVDSYQWSKGNPSVSAFQQYDTKLEFDGRFKDISLKFSVANTYSHNPIMGAKTYIDKQIVKSYYNSGYNNDFIVKAQLRMPVFIKQLNLSLEGGWHKSVSEGLNYIHNYSQPFINAQPMYVNGPWWVMLKYNTTYNALWGEDIYSTNNNMLNIGVGYTYRNATFMAGAFNPIGNIRVKSRDLNAIAGFDRDYQVSSTRQLFWVGVTLNLYKGKKRSASQRKLNNSQTYESINNVKK